MTRRSVRVSGSGNVSSVPLTTRRGTIGWAAPDLIGGYTKLFTPVEKGGRNLRLMRQDTRMMAEWGRSGQQVAGRN